MMLHRCSRLSSLSILPLSLPVNAAASGRRCVGALPQRKNNLLLLCCFADAEVDATVVLMMMLQRRLK